MVFLEPTPDSNVSGLFQEVTRSRPQGPVPSRGVDRPFNVRWTRRDVGVGVVSEDSEGRRRPPRHGSSSRGPVGAGGVTRTRPGCHTLSTGEESPVRLPFRPREVRSPLSTVGVRWWGKAQRCCVP